ncbi:MAG: 4Fe-4S dicluster domain-containing protein [Methanosarcinaceae archaeon]|nr:4Fe-4S dicluster domain-containing protein [Methanosarcinaceae archaeon]MDD4331129.1 4Fe-4S dicluster domain-containing protein [Methanosarcinaceae archaeon]MDD4749279.1 4Fe-4S dicluster domain-containing protein [Methanosarcinaceae archaeon]
MSLIQIEEYETPPGKTLVETIKASIRTSETLGLERCIQCGACTASCPAARFTDYNPRSLVKSVLENNRGVLELETLWNCFYCYTCQLRCPRGNSPAKLVQVLRQLALNEGKGLENMEHFLDLGEFFAAHGISRLPDYYLDKMAEAFGESWIEFKKKLPELRKELELEPLYIRDERLEIRGILEGTGHFERVKKLKRGLKESATKKKGKEEVNFEKCGRYSGKEAFIV